MSALVVTDWTLQDYRLAGGIMVWVLCQLDVQKALYVTVIISSSQAQSEKTVQL